MLQSTIMARSNSGLLAAVQVVATVGLGKTTLCLVRLGLEAQTTFGLLYETEDGWRGLIRPRDYALLC